MQPTTKKQISIRLAKAKGHLKKVQKMVEEDAYCPNTIHQSKAVQAALKKVDELILDGHLHTCVFDKIGGNKAKKEKLIREIVGLFKQNGS